MCPTDDDVEFGDPLTEEDMEHGGEMNSTGPPSCSGPKEVLGTYDNGTEVPVDQLFGARYSFNGRVSGRAVSLCKHFPHFHRSECRISVSGS